MSRKIYTVGGESSSSALCSPNAARYRVSEEEIQEQWKQYRNDYPEFIPYNVSEAEQRCLSARFKNLMATQNGQDFDDYAVVDGNKVERYLGDVPSGSSVVFLGTGTGREVRLAKDLGFDAIGVTLGSRNVYFGRHYLGLGEQELIECSHDVLPFAKETFDVVAGFQVFEHVFSPLLFLLEQSRVLKFGGLCIMEWPNSAKHNDGPNPHHQVCYTPGQAEALFKKAGFGNISVCYGDLSPIPENEWWCGDAEAFDANGIEYKRFYCIKGIKESSSQEYIRRAWDMPW